MKRNDWNEVRLRYVVDLNPSVPPEIRRSMETEVSFLPMEAIGEDGSFDATKTRRVEDVLTGYSFFANGDIAYAKVTPCFENGKAAVLDGLVGQVGFGTTEVTVVRAKDDVDTRFLFYVLIEDRFKQLGKAEMTGAGGLKRVPESFTRNFKVMLPSLAEQRAIAGYLDHETAEISAFIADQEELVGLLNERRAATITQSVTKGLDEDAEMKDSGVEWLGKVPAHWTINKFGRCVRISSGQVDPRVEPFSSMVLIAPNHVESGTGKLLGLETAEEQGADSGKYEVTKGHLIYSKIRPNLMKVVTAPVDCLCSADMYGLNADQSQITNDFLKLLLLSRPFHDYAVDQSMRVAMPKLNHDTLKAVPLWFPSLEEQATIVKHVEYELDEIDAAIADAKEAIELSKERRAALISAVVTGKIDVRNHITAELGAA